MLRYFIETAIRKSLWACRKSEHFKTSSLIFVSYIGGSLSGIDNYDWVVLKENKTRDGTRMESQYCKILLKMATYVSLRAYMYIAAKTGGIFCGEKWCIRDCLHYHCSFSNTTSFLGKSLLLPIRQNKELNK